MSKITSFLTVIALAITLTMSLLPTPVSSDDSVAETCGTQFSIRLVSEDCESAPGNIWPANKIPHFIIEATTCCSGGGEVCSLYCGSDGGSWDGLMIWDRVSGPITDDVRFVASDITCHGQGLTKLSQLLSPGYYNMSSGFGFQVITETVALKPFPSPTPTYGPGQVEGYVWEDVNGDGIQDDDEPGLAGVSVSLISYCTEYTEYSEYTEYGDVMNVHAHVTSDSQGFYRFIDVAPTLSRLFHQRAVLFDSELKYTKPNQGIDDMQDSDATDTCPSSGWEQSQCIIGKTNELTMPITGTLHGLDAGLLSTPTPTATPTLMPTATPTFIMEIYLPLIGQ